MTENRRAHCSYLSYDRPARVVLTCDPSKGWGGDPQRHLLLRPAPARLRRHGVGALLEVRLDAWNALDHTQFTGVNNVAAFASLQDPSITNLAYDASGNLARNNGFGSITGVRPPRTIQLVTRLTF